METNQENYVVQEGPSILDFKRNCSAQEFPNKLSRYLMNKGDIYYWKPGKFHLVTNSNLAKEVFKRDSFSADRSQFFISRMPEMDLSLIKDFFSVVQKMMVMSDGTEHQARRKMAVSGFEDEMIDKFKNKIISTVEHLVDSSFQNDRIEFVSQIAQKLPSTVLADLFDIPEEDRAQFYRWSIDMTEFFGGATTYFNKDGMKVNLAAVALRDYFLKTIEKRRSQLGDDYLSSLIRSQSQFNLSDQEVVSQAIMMLVAGQVTTTDQICNLMYLFASHSELQFKLHSNIKLLPLAIEEGCRYDPAVTFLFRVSKEDQFLGGQLIKKGETVFISNHAVNRSTSIEEPFKFDPQRKNSVHMAFGHGSHYCLGASLGRLQMQALFQRIFEKYPFFTIHKDFGAQRDHYSLSFSGFKNLYLDLVRS